MESTKTIINDESGVMEIEIKQSGLFSPGYIRIKGTEKQIDSFNESLRKSEEERSLGYFLNEVSKIFIHK